MKIGLAFKVGFGTVIGIVSYMLGGFDNGIKYLLIAITLDYIFGIMAAVYQKNYSYTTAWKGIFKKIGFFGIVAVSVLVERSIGKGEFLHPYIIYYLIGNECFSMLKNFKILGVPIPDIFQKEITDMYDKYNPFKGSGS